MPLNRKLMKKLINKLKQKKQNILKAVIVKSQTVKKNIVSASKLGSNVLIYVNVRNVKIVTNNNK